MGGGDVQIVSLVRFELLVELDLNHYRSIRREKKPDKRVFIRQVDVPPAATDGWYSARITLTDNEVFTAKDYVIIYKLPQAGGQTRWSGR